MTERLVRMTDEQLGAALGRLGDELAWPGTPDVAGAVIDAIREERSAPSLVAPRLSMPSRRRTLLVIAAALLALAGVALAARFHRGAAWPTHRVADERRDRRGFRPGGLAL